MRRSPTRQTSFAGTFRILDLQFQPRLVVETMLQYCPRKMWWAHSDLNRGPNGYELHPAELLRVASGRHKLQKPRSYWFSRGRPVTVDNPTQPLRPGKLAKNWPS